MIQIDRETFQMMLHQIMERFDKIEDKLSRMNRQTSALDGDKLLDNQDMCELLGITKRTLARYRQKNRRCRRFHPDQEKPGLFYAVKENLL